MFGPADVFMFYFLLSPQCQISHALIEKESRHREGNNAPQTVPENGALLDDRCVTKMKDFVKAYLYKLGYKKTDPSSSNKD